MNPGSFGIQVQLIGTLSRSVFPWHRQLIRRTLSSGSGRRTRCRWQHMHQISAPWACQAFRVRLRQLHLPISSFKISAIQAAPLLGLDITSQKHSILCSKVPIPHTSARVQSISQWKLKLAITMWNPTRLAGKSTLKVDVLPLEKNWKRCNDFRFYVHLPGGNFRGWVLLMKWNAT